MIRKLGHALPCAKRAFFLKRRIDRNLIQSLDQVISVCYEEGWCDFSSLLSKIPQHTSDLKLSPFLYTIYNKLLEAGETEDRDSAEKLLQTLKTIPVYIKDQILNYQDPSITELLWKEVEWISFREIPEGGQLSPCDSALWQSGQELVKDALEVMAEGAPQVYEELKNLVNMIILVDSERFIGGSSFDIQGCILLKVAPQYPLLEIVDILVHEAAHQYIFLLSTLDPLCLNDRNKLYPSPLRKDPRPIMGNFHAIFVLGRFIYTLNFLRDSSYAERLGACKLKEKIDLYKEKISLALPCFYEHAHLTALGARLIGSVESMLK
jgi:hypothetical protein